MLLLCVGGLTAVVMQVRCIDAAREAARLVARGDGAAARSLVPGGAALELRRDGGYIIARVTDRSVVLPGILIVGEAVAAAEPGR